MCGRFKHDCPCDTLEPIECIHHWVIEPANGPVSIGTCNLCNTTREFENSITLDSVNPHSPRISSHKEVDEYETEEDSS